MIEKMKQLEEESTMTWKSILERFLGIFNLKLVLLKRGISNDNYEAYDAKIVPTSGNSTCIIHALSEESSQKDADVYYRKTIDGHYSVIYPIRYVIGHTEEEACFRMLKAIVGTEIHWVKEDFLGSILETYHVEVPRISTSSIHAARISLDMVETEHGA